MRPKIPNEFLSSLELAEYLTDELFRDDARVPAVRQLTCRYHRCGGSGDRDTDKNWPARVRLTIDDQIWLVCEGCADLLVRGRPAGVVVRRENFR